MAAISSYTLVKLVNAGELGDKLDQVLRSLDQLISVNTQTLDLLSNGLTVSLTDNNVTVNNPVTQVGILGVPTVSIVGNVNITATSKLDVNIASTQVPFTATFDSEAVLNTVVLGTAASTPLGYANTCPIIESSDFITEPVGPNLTFPVKSYPTRVMNDVYIKNTPVTPLAVVSSRAFPSYVNVINGDDEPVPTTKQCSNYALLSDGATNIDIVPMVKSVQDKCVQRIVAPYRVIASRPSQTQINTLIADAGGFPTSYFKSVSTVIVIDDDEAIPT